MNESEKSRLQNNMHNIIPFLYKKNIYHYHRKKFGRINTKMLTVVRLLVFLFGLFVFCIFSTMNMDWSYNN